MGDAVSDAIVRLARLSRLLLVGGVAALLVFAPPGIAASDMISEPMAVLQGLDKITARVSEIEAPVGQNSSLWRFVDHGA